MPATQTIKQQGICLGLIFLSLVCLLFSRPAFAIDSVAPTPRNDRVDSILSGHGQNATQEHESAMVSLSPNLSPASGREERNESLRDFQVKDGNKIAATDFVDSKEVGSFIGYMVERHGFRRDELIGIFRRVQLNYQSIQLIKPPPVSKPKNWHAYRARFVEPIRIAAGVEFWNKYANALSRAEKQFGVPAQIIVGIIGVETTFGQNLGNFRIIDVLSTLAFYYPESPNKEKRMAYFREELEQFLLLTRESGLDPFSSVGSYAGAVGWPQFMPSNIRQHAIDFDGDGKIDLRSSPEDAIGSVANFLVENGWQAGLPLVFPATTTDLNPDAMVATELNATFTLQQLASAALPTQKNVPSQLLYGLIDLQNGQAPTEYWFATQNFFVLTRYNRSYYYAMAVIELGKAICFNRAGSYLKANDC